MVASDTCCTSFQCVLNDIPADTQRCINVEIWLNIGHDVVQPYFNVDTTSKLQR